MWLHSAGREAGVWTWLETGTLGLDVSLRVVQVFSFSMSSTLNLPIWLLQQCSQTSYLAVEDIQEAKIETSRPFKNQ